ncbi:MAG: ABC transporter substrate-binding protein, partial [Acidimicrobiia bacterium]|nr:ABC transporter substrate-binding protein [Acidimicrobiia bacterium]
GNPKYPWLIGSTLSPYSAEVKAFVDYLKQNKPNATVAILSATDDFGQAYEKTFKSLIKGTKIKVVKEQTYNPEDNKVDSQVTSLAASKADAFLMGATLLACPAALKQVQATGWKTIVYGSATCAAKTLIGLAGPAADGLISSTNIKDPSNPRYKSDPAMQLYMTNIEKYWPGNKANLDKTNGIVAYGWTQGALLAATLEKAKAATRAAVMTSARNIDIGDVGLLFEGAEVHSGKDDPFLGEQFQLVKYGAAQGYFDNVGSLLDFDGKTASFTPQDVING